MSAYPLVFSPLSLGSLTLANRICHAATLTNLAENNLPSVPLIDYYARRAKGGAGLIVSEIVAVHPTSVPTRTIINGCDPGAFDGLQRIADAAHRNDAPIVAQLWHSGRQQLWTPVSAPWAPSALPDPMSGVIPHEMTLAEVREVQEGFIATARRAEKAGFDGVELHGAHGYLINQFLSPWSNQRLDEYGGSLENRVRFLAQLITGIRGACSSRFVVGVKLNGHDFVAGGVTPEEAGRTVGELRRTARVDYVAVSQGNFSKSLQFHVPGMHLPAAPFSFLARGIREVSGGTPVGSMGRIRTLAEAEELLRTQQADFIGMSRALVCDPDLPLKGHTGKEHETRRCIYCNVCWHRVQQGQKIACTYYPELGGREPEREAPVLARHPKHVAVVGGGPAGLAAAYRLAMLGHRVTLFEASAELGGQVRLAARLPGQGEFLHLVEYYARRIEDLGVEVRFGAAIGVAEIKDLGPDAVIVATGSKPDRPAWPGHEAIRVLSAVEALSGSAVTGTAVLVMDYEGSATAARVVEWLADQGKRPILVTPFEVQARNTDLLSRQAVYRQLRSRGVEHLTDSLLHGLDHGALLLRDLHTDAISRRAVDSVVEVGRHRARDALQRDLAGIFPVVHRAGDCYAPRTIISAVHEGDLAARSV